MYLFIGQQLTRRNIMYQCLSLDVWDEVFPAIRGRSLNYWGGHFSPCQNIIIYHTVSGPSKVFSIKQEPRNLMFYVLKKKSVADG